MAFQYFPLNLYSSLLYMFFVFISKLILFISCYCYLYFCSYIASIFVCFPLDSRNLYLLRAFSIRLSRNLLLFNQPVWSHTRGSYGAPSACPAKSLLFTVHSVTFKSSKCMSASQKLVGWNGCFSRLRSRSDAVRSGRFKGNLVLRRSKVQSRLIVAGARDRSVLLHRCADFLTSAVACFQKLGGSLELKQRFGSWRRSCCKTPWQRCTM